LRKEERETKVTSLRALATFAPLRSFPGIRMSEGVDYGRTSNKNDSRRYRGCVTWGWRRRKRDPRTHLGQLAGLSLERRGGEMQYGPGPMLRVERDAAVGGFRRVLVRMRMGVRVRVRVRVLGRGAGAVRVVVPVIEVVEGGEGVESEKPAQGGRGSPETGTSPPGIGHRACMIVQVVGWRGP